MRILFVLDPLAELKPLKDSSIAMMREAQRRSHTVWACEPKDIVWASNDHVRANAQQLQLAEGLKADWYTPVGPSQKIYLRDFDVVLMRKDPPFDAEYIYTTHLLGQAEREGAWVLNNPSALRGHPEKLALMEFAEYAPPTLVSRDALAVRAFHAQHQDIILKPLDGMGGMGIFRVREDGLNLGSILESLTGYGQQTIMAQAYLPAIAEGDKRILLIDGRPVPFCLARIPQAGETRGNLAAGGKGVAQALSEHDTAMALALGQILAPRGLFLVGLDVIGTMLTEVNVTSPTCFQEISTQTGCDVAALFIDALEQRLLSRRV